MWRILIVLTLVFMVAACSPAAVPPADEAAEPEQIEAVGHAVTELAAQLNMDVESIRLVKVEDAEWTDSCLGLGGPAESCALVMTPGYRITLEADGTEYVFRTDESGSAVRLELTTE